MMILLNHQYKERQLHMSKEDKSNRMIPYVVAKRAFRNDGDVKSCSPYKGGNGFDFLIDYMIKRDYVKLKDNKYVIQDRLTDDYNNWR